jgi:ligand-binding sensor domain-containing protein/two-component sensor histidine kinase
MCLGEAAFSLDPSRRVSQYVHEHWGEERGFVGGPIYAIAQSADGYLWIGTERGLVRFDGSSFTLIQRPISDQPSVGRVRGLISDTDGNLWIFLDGPRTLLYHDGKFEDIYTRFDLQGMIVTAATLDYQYRILFAGLGDRTLRYDHKQFETVVNAEENPGTVLSLAATRDQSVWLGTRENGLFHSQNGHISQVVPELRNSKINCLAPSRSGGLWIGTNDGVYLLEVSSTKLFALPSLRGLQILAMKTDHDDNLWVGTNHGVLRITSFGTVSLDLFDRKAIHEVRAIFEDPDGDIWFGGPQGVELLRNGMLTSYSAADGLPATGGGPIYIDSEDRVWFAPISGGLFLIKAGHATPVTLAGLDHDVVYSISGGGNEVWVGRQHDGLTVLTESGHSFSARTYRKSAGLAQNSVYSVQRGRNGTIWAGTVNSGVSRLSGGSFTNYSDADGLPSNSVNSIAESSNGTIWVATPNGLASYSNAHWKNYSARDGLPSSSVRVVFEDPVHNLWIATSGGLSYLSSGKIRVPGNLPGLLREQIFGIAEDSMGYLWFTTSDHVVRVNRERLLAGSLLETDIQSFGVEDGLKGTAGVSRVNTLVADHAGRIWLSLSSGLSMAAPDITVRKAVPVAVRIESISAGGRQFDSQSNIRIPPGIQNITLNYGGTNLSAPERIRFRYELDGSGQGWSDILASKQLVFSNLGPGSYRFRILASNSVGLWNGPETSLLFIIEPAFWQTWWFRAALLLFAGLVTLAIYRRRVHQLTGLLNLRFEERLAERTRIAQELHDTLLQSFQGLILRFQAANQILLSNPSEAKETLEGALDRADQALSESRKAIQGIRSDSFSDPDIEHALGVLMNELAADSHLTRGKRPTTSVIVEGQRQTVNPWACEEICKIAREALRNAFTHGNAQHIESEIAFSKRFLRVRFRDDGVGVDPAVLEKGVRAGHWGLTGMNERAKRLRGHLTMWSKPNAGTEVEVTIPASTAFKSRPSRIPFNKEAGEARFDA